MPVILFAQVVCGVGSGLLTTLRTDTSTALWATYMALTGLGLGLGVNVPHIAIQAVMKTLVKVLVAAYLPMLTSVEIISDNDVFIANGSWYKSRLMTARRIDNKQALRVSLVNLEGKSALSKFISSLCAH